MVTDGGVPPAGSADRSLVPTLRLRGRTRWLQLLAAPAGLGLLAGPLDLARTRLLAMRDQAIGEQGC
jgi:hypothetical protein